MSWLVRELSRPRDVQSASWRICKLFCLDRELSSPRLVQSVSWLVRELSRPRDIQSASWQSASWRICKLSSNLCVMSVSNNIPEFVWSSPSRNVFPFFQFIWCWSIDSLTHQFILPWRWIYFLLHISMIELCFINNTDITTCAKN